MASITLLSDCYDAVSACGKLDSDIDTNINAKLAEIHNFLALKTDDYFDKAFLLGGYNPLKKKRDEIVDDIGEFESLNSKYRDVIKQRFWAWRLRDLQTYRSYLEAERAKCISKQDELVKSMQKESNYQGIQGSTRYSDYLDLKHERAELNERIEGCDAEIEKAKGKISSIGSVIAGGY